MPVNAREERRLQRKAQRQAVQRSTARSVAVRRNAVLGAGAIVLVAAVVLIFILVRGQSATPAVPGETHFNDPVTNSGQLYQHIPDSQPIPADPAGHYPPVFGNHYAEWRPPGIYDSPVPEGNFIHDLEHGGIVILYNCPSGCPELVNQLKGLLTSLPKSSQYNEVKLVISPNTKIQHQLALLAWDYEKDLDSFDESAIRQFYTAHLDRGPEHVAI
ncbi:MAG TPA: DUF3105 domain-containing protein [Chloroflexota bacterium]